MSELVLVPLPSTDRRWRVRTPWRAHGYTVPAGFTTDLASFPRFIEPIMHRNSWCWIAAGVLHDWLYRTGHRSRSHADATFRDVAIAEGAPRYQAVVCWCAVRLFGRRAWRSHRREQGEK